MNKNIAVRGGVLFILFSWLIYAYPNFYPIPEVTAKLVGFFLKFISIGSVSHGKYLIVDFIGTNRIFELSAECSGIVIFSIFLFGVFIVPGYSFPHRLITVGFIPILFFGNAVRILLSVVLARNYSVDFSIFFHNTFGQVIIFGITILCYIFALKICNNFPSESALKS